MNVKTLGWRGTRYSCHLKALLADYNEVKCAFAMDSSDSHHHRGATGQHGPPNMMEKVPNITYVVRLPNILT